VDEEWKPAPDCGDRYSVSNHGRCARTKTHDGRDIWRILNGRLEGNGYITFHLYIDGKQKHPLAHRIVWAAFHGPIPKGLEINHKNGVKYDNHLANLELVTRSENMLHGFRTLGFSRNRMKGSDHPKAKLSEDDVKEILALRQGGMRRYLVAKKFNVSSPAIRRIEMGLNWSHFTGLEQTEKPAFHSPSSQGSGNGFAILTEEDIPRIFEMRSSGLSQSAIAKLVGISQAQVWRILHKKRWSSVDT
jgi:HNH endonuclease/Helix-turn-helix domain of resolvase